MQARAILLFCRASPRGVANAFALALAFAPAFAFAFALAFGAGGATAAGAGAADAAGAATAPIGAIGPIGINTASGATISPKEMKTKEQLSIYSREIPGKTAMGYRLIQ